MLMPKKKLVTVAEEFDVEFDEAIKIVKEKIPAEYVTGKGKKTWISKRLRIYSTMVCSLMRLFQGTTSAGS